MTNKYYDGLDNFFESLGTIKQFYNIQQMSLEGNNELPTKTESNFVSELQIRLYNGE